MARLACDHGGLDASKGQVTAASRRSQLVFGGLFVLVGLAMMVTMTASPEGRNVPYWVAVLGGVTRWLAPAIVLCLATPGLWMLFAPDP